MSSGQLIFPFLVFVCPSLWQWLQVRFLFVVGRSSSGVKTPSISHGRGHVSAAV